MIRTVKGELVAECNECGDEHYGGVLEFRPFIADLKDNGWKIKPDGDGGWEHLCPECAEEE